MFYPPQPQLALYALCGGLGYGIGPGGPPPLLRHALHGIDGPNLHACLHLNGIPGGARGGPGNGPGGAPNGGGPLGNPGTGTGTGYG